MIVITGSLRCVDKCGRKIFVHIMCLLYQMLFVLQVFLCNPNYRQTCIILLVVEINR